MGYVDLFFDLVYSGPEITVSAITERIFIRSSLDPIYRCPWVISKSISQMGYLNLIFDLVKLGSQFENTHLRLYILTIPVSAVVLVIPILKIMSCGR